MGEERKTLSVNRNKRTSGSGAGAARNGNSDAKSKNHHERLLKKKQGGAIQAELMGGGMVTGKLIDSDRYSLTILDNETTQEITVFKHAISSFY